MTSATPKPSAGEQVPEFGCNKKTLYAIADAMIERLRGCGESAALVRQAIDERDLLRARERELVEALETILRAEFGSGMVVPAGCESTYWGKARALLAKHGR